MGSIGELVAAAATVATLAYLAIQVRGNSIQLAESGRLARLGLQDWTVGAFSRYRGLMSQPENAALYVRGLGSYSGLSQPDQVRFRALLEEYFFIYRRIHQQMVLGYDYPSWAAQARGAASVLTTSGGAEWWNERKYMFDEAFVIEMERLARADRSAT